MLKVAFASFDGQHVDQHFGASEQLMIYLVQPGEADLLAVGRFEQATMKGEHKDKALGYEVEAAAEPEAQPVVEETPELMSEDKVIAKIEFIGECAAVYAASIGTSSIRRLMQAGIQPVIVDYGHEMMDLLNEVSFALVHGGLSWVDRAKAREKSQDRFLELAEEQWSNDSSFNPAVNQTFGQVRHQLMTDIPE